MKTILVVDDEPKIATLARDYLEHAGFAVLTAGDGPSALSTIRQRRPDLVVLDLGLPGLDGLDVTRELRRNSTIPIVMLTARDDELDKLLGLELGADDYLTKPFSPRELVARVRAVLRRADRAPEAAETIRAGDVVLDLPRMRAEVEGAVVDLTPTEFQLLAHDGGAARPDLHPRPAARRAPRDRLRDLRARHRLARQEPAPQGRAGPARRRATSRRSTASAIDSPTIGRPTDVTRATARLRVPPTPADGRPVAGARRTPPRAGRRANGSPRTGWGRLRRGDMRTAREEWRRHRMEEMSRGGLDRRPPWARWRGFGCIFGLLFLFVIGVAGRRDDARGLAARAVPGLVALAVVIGVLIWMGRTLFLTPRHSTDWSTPRAGSRPATTPSGSTSTRARPAVCAS